MIWRKLVNQIIARKRSLSEETDGGHKWRNRKGIRKAKILLGKNIVFNIWKKRNERPNVGRCLSGVGTVLRLEKDGWVINGQMTKASNK